MGCAAVLITQSPRRCNSCATALIDQGFVTLHIDDQGLIVQAQEVAGFGQTVAARDVVHAGEDGLNAVRLAGLHDALIVGRHHTALCGAALRLLGHAHHHRCATNVGQGFVGQAARRHARRDQHGEGVVGGGAHVEGLASRSASSSVITRASCSSKMGMPSRMG